METVPTRRETLTSSTVRAYRSFVSYAIRGQVSDPLRQRGERTPVRQLLQSKLDTSVQGTTGTKDHTHHIQEQKQPFSVPLVFVQFLCYTKDMLVSPSTTQQQDAPCQSIELS